jgi:hypothetical protein
MRLIHLFRQGGRGAILPDVRVSSTREGMRRGQQRENTRLRHCIPEWGNLSLDRVSPLAKFLQFTLPVMQTRKGKREPSSRFGFTRGASMTEYVILVGFVGIVAALALAARGKTLLFDYTNARDLVLLPAQ